MTLDHAALLQVLEAMKVAEATCRVLDGKTAPTDSQMAGRCDLPGYGIYLCHFSRTASPVGTVA